MKRQFEELVNNAEARVQQKRIEYEVALRLKEEAENRLETCRCKISSNIAEDIVALEVEIMKKAPRHWPRGEHFEGISTWLRFTTFAR